MPRNTWETGGSQARLVGQMVPLLCLCLPTLGQYERGVVVVVTMAGTQGMGGRDTWGDCVS